MQNETTQNMGKQAKLSYVDIYKLKENPLNQHRELKDVELLAMNILSGGLQQPIVIKPDYTIITGHKRTSAIKQICDEGKSYLFNGRECIDEIPAFIVKFEDELQERLGVLQSNAHNDETKEEKIIRTKEAEEIYEMLCERNRKPVGLKRKWIAGITGYSERSVQDYLTQEDPHSKSIKEPKKLTVQSVIKKVKTMNDWLSELDLSELGVDELMDAEEVLRDAINIIERIL